MPPKPLLEVRQYHTLIAHTWMRAPGLATIPLLLGYLTLADILLERPGPRY